MKETKKTYRGMSNKEIEKTFSTSDIIDNRKVAIYVRESSKRQAEEGYNIHAQEQKCKEFIHCILDEEIDKNMIYREKGYSAKTVDRPVINVLIDDIKKGKIKTLVVQKLDRLVRRNKGLYDLLELFMEFDVRLITLRENIDTATQVWKMVTMFNIMLAEIEQDTISERTNEAMLYGAEQGSYIKGGKAPFGTAKEKIYHEDGSHTIILHRHPWEWEVLQRIYDLAYAGKNCVEIKNIVSSLPIMKAHGKSYSEDQIGSILSNPIYKGYMPLKGKLYKIDFADCMAESYWEQVQINRAVHLRNNPLNEYLYHGKVFCGCGTLCVVDVSNKRLADGTLKKYKYYVCPHCKKRISEQTIKENTEHKLKHLFEVAKTETYKEQQIKKLDRLVTLKEQMFKLYADGKIDVQTYIREIEKSKETVYRINKRITRRKRSYDKLSVDERMEWLDGCIDGIIVNMTQKAVKINLRS